MTAEHPEAAPDGRLLDAHHHLWDTGALSYPLFRDLPELNRPFTLAAYRREAEELGVTASIVVEAASAGADGRSETQWLLRESADESVLGMVAWAPLEQPGLTEYLSWLRQIGGTRIVGVRRSFEFEEPRFPCRPEVIDGARAAGAAGLVVDLVLYAPSLAATITLVDSCPQTQFVLDHLGKPAIRDRRLQPWATELAELAQRPNVVAKLSGLTTEADRERWTIDELRPYVAHAFETFGPDRLLYGSDWPVAALAGGQPPWLAAVRRFVSEYAPEKRAAVLYDNAVRVYRPAGVG